MTKRNMLNRYRSLLFVCLTLISNHVFAISFGIYDPRTLALGGTSVALSKPSEAHFYNPALTVLPSFGSEQSSRQAYLPRAMIEYTKNTGSAINVAAQKVDERLAIAVINFNRDPTIERVQTILDEFARVEAAVEKVNGERYWVESFAGMSLTENRSSGGESMFLGVRLLGGGDTNFREQDLAALRAYESTFAFFNQSTGNADPNNPVNDGVDNPRGRFIDVYRQTLNYINGNSDDADFEELQALYEDAFEYLNESVGDDGRTVLQLLTDDLLLANPADLLKSSANVEGAVITEWGTSFAHQFSHGRNAYSIGFAPKIMIVDVYEENIIFGRNKFRLNGRKDSYIDVNVDLGAAMAIGPNIKVGLAIKDAIPTEYQEQGRYRVEFSRRARMGAAYSNPFMRVGIDIDITRNDSIAREPTVQEFALGGEFFSHKPYNLRVGYRYDLVGNRDPTFSVGVGVEHKQFFIDLSLANSRTVFGGAAQFGWLF